MIPVGKHLGKAISAQMCDGKNAPYVSATIGLNGFTDSLYYNGSLSEKPFQNPREGIACPADVTIRDLITMGWDGKDWSGFSGLGSREVEFVTIHEEYNGKIQAKVKFVNVPGAFTGNAKPLDANKAKTLQASLKGRVLAAQKAAQLAPKAAGSPPSGVDDDSFEYGANAPNDI